MQKIIAPLRQGDTSDAVSNLQDALRLLVKHGHIQLESNEATNILNELGAERRNKIYDGATAKLVLLFRMQHNLNDIDEVDEATAAAINALLDELGLLDATDAPKFYVVSGEVQREDRLPLRGMKVRAFHESERGPIRLGEDTSDAEGRYTIRYELLPGVESINLRVTVFDADGKSLGDSDLIRDAQPLEFANLIVAIQPEPEELPLIVRGQVRQLNGNPLSGALVRAFDQDLRKEQLLGITTTDETGRYKIQYQREQFAHAERGTAELIVRAFHDDGANQPLVESRVRINVGNDATVDLVVPSPPLSEWERIGDAVLPLLDGQGERDDQPLPPGELNDRDIDFIVADTGLDREQVRLWALAARTAQDSPAIAEVGADLSFMAFYGWFRQGMPTSLEGLFDQNEDVLRRALNTSIRDKIIPAAIGNTLDTFLAGWQQLVVERLLKPSEVKSKASIGDLLRTVLPNLEKQQALATLFIRHKRTSDEFWNAVRAIPGFVEREVAQIQTALQLGELSNNHLPLVRELQRMGTQNSTFAELRGFAQLDESGWHEVLERSQPDGTAIGFPADTLGATDQEKLTNYAQSLSQFITNTFPTAVIANRLVKDTGDDSPFKSVQTDLKTFFDNNPSFEFRTTPVELFLSDGREQKLLHVSDPQELLAQLRNMQRLFKITPYFEQMRALLTDDLHSSQAILHLGQREFVERHGITFGGEVPALSAYQQAEHVHLTALMLYAKHSMAFNSPTPYVIAGEPIDRMTQRSLIPEDTPDWTALFGSLDLCDCEHCKSMYSPAAYLVDILKFLSDGQKNKEKKTPLQVLFDRRPDIGYTELTCENTDTKMPYVDLVNEALENAIIRWVPQEIRIPAGQDLVIDLNSNKLPTEVKNAITELPEISVPLSEQATVTVIKSDQEWRVIDAARDWTIKYISAELEITRDKLTKIIPLTETSKSVQILNRHSVPPELSREIKPIGFAVAKNFSVASATHGSEWLMTCDYEWQIEFMPRGSGSYFEISTDNHSVTRVPIAAAPEIGRDLRNGQISKSLADFLGIVQTNCTVREVIPDQKWQLVYTVQVRIKYLANILNITSLDLQTSGTTAERNANPEHTNPKAYDQLVRAVYPWSLPFNLWAEETRVYLEHLGVQRHEVMETFFKPPPSLPSLTDAGRGSFVTGLDRLRHEVMETFFNGTSSAVLADNDIAREYLGLTQAEAEIIIGSQLDRPWEFWGLLQSGNDIAEPANGTAHVKGDWDTILKHVSIFLQQSGLKYKDLLELLGTHFINPMKADGRRTLSLIAIEKDEGGKAVEVATCQLDKLRIEGLDLPTLGKIHRFVRLWRKLGWTMRDLDKTITALNVTDLNVAFLLQLSHIQRLRATLNVPLVRMLSWWAAIDTTHYIDHSTEGQPKAPSLYAQLFRNKTVLHPLDPAFAEDANGLNGKLSDHLPMLVAALGISTADVTLMINDPAVIPGDTLNLANLSSLYRNTSLAKALKMTIAQFLMLPKLTGVYPFAASPTTAKGPAATLRFLEMVNVIRASGFSLSELDYLLRNEFVASIGIAPTDDSIAVLLSDIRDGLQKIQIEMALVPDLTGEMTGQKLALLNWDNGFIEPIMAALNSNPTFEVTLNEMPSKAVFPNDVKERVAYDSSSRKLRFINVMTAVDKASLLGVTLESSYQLAVNQLFDASQAYVTKQKDFVTNTLKAFEYPTFGADLTDPPKVNFPNELKNKIYYDAAAHELRFIGLMSDNEKKILLNLQGADALYKIAIETLWKAPTTFVPDSNNRFLTASDAAQLFDSARSAEERFNLVLTKLMPHLVTLLSEHLVQQKLGEALKLDAESIGQLLAQQINPPTNPATRYIDRFLTSEFSASNPALKITAAAFNSQFTTFRLLHKVAMLITKFKITPEQLGWLFDHGSNRGWLDLTLLPTTATATSAALFTGWARLADLFRLRDTLPLGELTLFDLFDVALQAKPATLDTAKTQYLDALSKHAQWPMPDLETLLGPRSKSGQTGKLGFDFPTGYQDERMLTRLQSCFNLMKRLGVSAIQLSDWGKQNQTSSEELTTAHSTKNAVKAKYDDQEWLTVAKPLKDLLREKQRAALVAYVIAHPDATKGQHWRDSNELYEYLLIDVEMDPCMVTTRIKQAISSAQLFIQRSLMNLEPEVSLTHDEAQEWMQWRKQYRIWEANRKVLFYPENWIEPELRDDKSPFFKDLENELLQSDLTADTAEDAFLHYLEKLDQVARLEIVGMYHQQEPGDIAQKLEPIDILHVFGRTYAVPHIYFYRRLENKVWSAWEKLDVDIEGDHLIPIVWNRRLHLFWAIFTEKSEQPTKEQRAKDEDPTKYWEIKLAWSEYKNARWSPKKLSKEYLRHDKYPNPPKKDPPDPNQPKPVPQDPEDFSFKSRIVQGKLGEQLSIECYGPSFTVLPPKAQDQSMVVNYYEITIQTGSRETWGAIWIKLVTLDGNKRVIYFKNSVNSGGVKLNNDDSVTVKVTLNFDVIDGIGLDLNQKNNPVQFIEVEWVESNGNDAWAFQGIEVRAKLANLTDTVPILINNRTGLFTRTPWLMYFHGMGHTHQTWTGSVHVTPPPAPTEATEPIIDPPMQGIGEFTLDDSNGNLAAKLVNTSLSQLEAIPGTQIQNMAMVDLNTSDALGNGSVLAKTPGTFRLLVPHPNLSYKPKELSYPLFYQDELHTYAVSLIPTPNSASPKIRFSVFFHPRIHDFMRSLNRFGINGLLTLANQLLTDDPVTFKSYDPQPGMVDPDYPREDVDFESQGAYSNYNWELFFHTPFLIAMQLSKNQRFEEAQKWFHYIFDPTSTDSPKKKSNPGPERFWRVKPFHDEAMQTVETLEALIANANEMQKQIDEWKANPFKPHVIARLRKVAYMKAVVMRYIDNLIAWGDQLFRRDTIESINEATQLYILAAQILGRRPEEIPPRATPESQTFASLISGPNGIDALGNRLVEIESFIFPSASPNTAFASTNSLGKMLYFCLPKNDKLLDYWNTVADRLFNIRHCMNIEGVERSLAIFEPPIDPGLLVRAAAAGVDISSAISDMNAALPHYRFNIMLQKATELCNDVKALGTALLSALEKRDVEELALLRSTHEVELLKAIREIKEQQVNEANNTHQGLLKYQEVVTARQQYYLSRPFMNAFEIDHLGKVGQSLIPMSLQLGAEVLAAVLHLVPDSKGGSPPTTGLTFGGRNIASAVQAAGSAAGAIASMLNTGASLSATLGSYQRRQEDWAHQAVLATKELEQVKKQIMAAEIRLAISEHELQNHNQQIENAKEVDEYQRYRKFTNRELYGWMVGQISSIYFQGYQLAYDAAKRAERAFRFELGLSDSNYVQFGYWDSLKKGLLSAERLYHDLKRMDVAYLDKNKREYEITKHISMVLHDPLALIKLKEAGQCEIELPEALFDADYPGHYMRRLKSVSLTIPCVVGPYTSINCTLTLLNSKTRFDSKASNAQAYADQLESQVKSNFGAIQSIATSQAQNDSGMFELNFRDERYLPFEGAGAISHWRIELPQDCNAFDFNTLSDVVLHLKYTARDGGAILKLAAKNALQTAIVDSENGSLARLFSAKHEFPTEWYRFLYPKDTDDRHSLQVDLKLERFPFQFRSKTITITQVETFLKLKDGVHLEDGKSYTATYAAGEPLTVSVKPPANEVVSKQLNSISSFFNGIPHSMMDVSDKVKEPNTWVIDVPETIVEKNNAGEDSTVPNIAHLAPALRQTITVNGKDHFRLNPDVIEDIWLICHYSLA